MKKESAPKNHELNKLATDLINQQSTMTVATAGGNAAWAAPVYYVFHKGALFFFSNPESRHIREASTNDEIAAAIYPSADTWQGIRGIQMSGAIRYVRPVIDGIQAVRAYIRKFPFIKEFFEPGQALDFANFSQRFKVKFYKFEPNLVFYLDNRIRFGFRVEVKLS